MADCVKKFAWAIATLLITSSPLTPPILNSGSTTASAQTIQEQKTEADRLIKEGEELFGYHTAQPALEKLQQALMIYKKIGDRESQANTIRIIGRVYYTTAQYQKALDFYLQALEIYQAIHDFLGEASTLNSIGTNHYFLGQYFESLTSYNRALQIHKKLGNDKGEASVSTNIGMLYVELGKPKEALILFQRALEISKKYKERLDEAIILHSIGTVYSSLVDFQEALIYYQQSLEVFKQVQEPVRQGEVLHSIAETYRNLNQPWKALEFHQRSLKIREKLENPIHLAVTLGTIGIDYESLNRPSKALDYYRRSLVIFQRLNFLDGESITLHLIGRLLKKQNQSALAILFYKQSINVREMLRRNIRSLSKEQQASYIQKIDTPYRELADLLLQQGAILEAQKVLELLKVQEIREITRDAGLGEKMTGLKITPAEQRILDQHGTLIAFSQKVYECKRDALRPCAELGELNQQLYRLNEQYTQAVQSFEREVRGRNDPDMVDPGKLVADAKPIVEAEPGTLLVYPLVLEDRTWLLWVARGGVVKSVEIPISRTQLGDAVVQFRTLVQDSRSSRKQVQAAGKRLYDVLFKSGAMPLETEMQRNQIRHLVFALDRVTRYIPMAALHDGQHYLGEKYTISTVISAGLTRTTRSPADPDRNPVLALGVSESVENMAPLENVPHELAAIVRQAPTDVGVYPGQTFLNREFNQQTLLTRLLGHTFLHIATHAAFLSDHPEQSFILMGTGKLTIPQIRSLPDLASVRMVVLSACETALGGADQEGVEISGMSSYFLNGGVETVIASLWAVDDASTSVLMQQFYRNLATGRMTKAEALRQAQLHLLKGGEVGDRVSLRSDVGVQVAIAPAARFSHPYYWAPFILIGNRL